MIIRTTLKPWLSTLTFGLLLCVVSTGSQSSSTTPGSTAQGATSPSGTTDPGSSHAALPPVPTLPSGIWLKGDLHNHSSYSPDAKKQFGDTVAISVRLAELQNLDYWALTDHNTIDGLKDPGFVSSRVILLPGEEWGRIAHGGAIGLRTLAPALDFRKPIKTWATRVQTAVDHVRAEGGIFIIYHPTRMKPWVWDIKNFDAVEVWNTFWGFSQNKILEPAMVDQKLALLVDNGLTPNPALKYAASFRLPKREQAIKFWEYYLNKGLRVAATGGGDRHMLVMPGYPTTFVYSRDRSRAGIYEAIRKGRTYVSNSPQGPHLAFTADVNNDGNPDVMFGGEVPVGAPVTFRVRVTDAKAGQVVIIKNGARFASWAYQNVPADFQFTDIPAPGDWWRVDTYETLDLTAPGARSLHQLAISKSTASADFKDPAFYSMLLNLAKSIPQIPLNYSYGTWLPTITWTRNQIRILNVDLLKPSRNRGTIGSPIYASR